MENKKLLSDAISKITSTSRDMQGSIAKLLAVFQAYTDGIIKTEEQFAKLVDEIPKNLESPEEYISNVLKSLKANNAEFQKFQKMTLDISRNFDTIVDYGEELTDFYTDLNSEAEFYLKTHDTISNSLQKQAELLKNKFKLEQGSIAYTRLMASHAETLQHSYSQFASLLASPADFSEISNNFENLIDQITSGDTEVQIRFDGETMTISALEAFERIRSSAKQFSDDLSADLLVNTNRMAGFLDAIRQNSNVDAGVFNILETSIQNITNSTKLLDKLQTTNSPDSSAIQEQYNQIISQAEILNSVLSDSNSTLSQADRILLEQYLTQLDITTQRRNELQTLLRIKDTFLQNLQTIKRTSTIVDSVADKFEGLISILPKGITSFLGLDDALSSIRSNSQSAIEEYYRQLAAGEGTFTALNKAVGKLGPGLKLAFHPISIAAITLGAIYKLVSSIEARYKDISEHTQMSLYQSKQMYKNSLDILTSDKNKITSMEDLIELQSSYIRSGATVLDLSKKSNQELAINLSETAKLFGYSNEEALDFYETMKSAGASTELVTTLQKTAGLAAEAAGLSAKIINKDLITAASEVATYYGNYPADAVKAAIETRRLGMNLKKAGEIAEKMLNIDSFMVDMYELAALTNGGIDLSKAFDMRMSGAPLEKITEEVMDSIGSLSEFNSQSEFVKRKLANTLDMSVGELANSLRLKELHGKLDGEQLKVLQSNLSTLGDISNVEAEVLQSRAAELQNAERFNTSMSKISNALRQQLLPSVEELAEWMSSSTDLIDGIVGLFKGAIGTVQILVGIIKMIGIVLKPILQGIGSIVSFLSGAKDPLNTINTEMSAISSGASTVGAILAGWVITTKGILPIIGGVKSSIGSIVDLVKKFKGKLLPDIGGVNTSRPQVPTPDSSIPELPNNSKFDKLLEGIKKIKPTDLIKVAAAMVIMSSALFITAKALKEFNDVDWTSLAKGGLALTGLTGGLFLLSKIPAGELIKGSAALAILGAALIPTAYALKMFNDIKWPALGKAGVALLGLTAAVMGLGTLMGPVGAAAIVLGAGALALMGASLIPFAIAAKLTAEAMDSLTPSLSKLIELDLLSAALGIGTLGAALAAFGAGSAISAISNLFSTLIGGDKVYKKLEVLATIGAPLTITAGAIERIANSISTLIKVIETLDTTKLQELSKLKISKIAETKVPSKRETAQDKAVPDLPRKEEVAQDRFVNDIINKKETDSDPYMDALNSNNTSTTSVSMNKVELLLTQLVTEIRKINDRPIALQIGGRTLQILNSELKTLNNRNG